MGNECDENDIISSHVSLSAWLFIYVIIPSHSHFNLIFSFKRLTLIFVASPVVWNYEAIAAHPTFPLDFISPWNRMGRPVGALWSLLSKSQKWSWTSITKKKTQPQRKQSHNCNNNNQKKRSKRSYQLPNGRFLVSFFFFFLSLPRRSSPQI